MMGLQVKNLFYCVIYAGFPHFRRIVSVGGDEIRQLLGDGGAGKGNRGSQLFGRGDGHDTGADGEAYARTARLVQKFIIHLVVEKELCNQKFSPSVTFFLQMEKIAVQILCFIMLFRVTGACNVEICGAVQITCQIRSMGLSPRRARTWFTLASFSCAVTASMSSFPEPTQVICARALIFRLFWI